MCFFSFKTVIIKLLYRATLFISYFSLSLSLSLFMNISDGGQKLKQLLSFAIGGLLGDVFLHLLPEAWAKAGPSGAPPLPSVSHVLL